MTQKFHKGDHVRIADDLGPSMAHFRAGCEAIVVGSYRDQYGGSGGRGGSYTLHIKGSGQSSWYYENQLTLIEAGRRDLLEQWEREKAEEAALKGNIDWIFEHGEDVASRPHDASIATLGRCIGIDNLWGSRGEGLTYFMNAFSVLEVARPYLRSKDKAGFLSACSPGNQGPPRQ